MSPVFPKRGAALPPKEDPGTNFGEDLVDYLATYKLPSVDEWIEVINGHDLSGARFFQIIFHWNWNDSSKLRNLF